MTMNLAQRLVVGLVRGYQWLLSPLFAPACRFEPSCSQYAIDAVRLRGAARGGMLALWRLLRCQPWNAGGYDPVPPVQRHDDHAGRSTAAR